MLNNEIDFSFTHDLKELQTSTNLSALFHDQPVPKDVTDTYWERYVPREPLR